MPEAPTRRFPQLAATPYPWPFDGAWAAAETALLLIGFGDNTIAALGADEAARTAATLATEARGAGLHVIHVGAPHASAWAEGDMLVPLAGGNAFFRTGLEAILRRHGIRNLLGAGLPTEGLLHASIRAANDMGFECLTVSDACQGTRPDFHAAQLRITTFGNGLFGTVAPAAAVLRSLHEIDEAS